MNLRLYIICIAAVIALVGPALANSTATVHGEVYGWDTFKPLENAVVEVNSTPSQSMVAKYGFYSFDLMPGDYTITARYYQNSTLIYSAEETVKIKDEGKYVLDLLLLPVYSEELMDGSGVNGFSENPNESAENSSPNTINPVTDAATGQITSSGKDNSSNMNPADQNGADPLNTNYLLTALLLLLMFAAGYRLSRKDKKTEENQTQKRVHITEKGHTTGEHTTGDLSEPVKVPGLSAETPDIKRVETFHRSVKQRLEAPHENIEPELKKESQVQESRVKPSGTASATEPVADPVKEYVREPVIESLKEPVKESVKAPVEEPVKSPVKESASEVLEKQMQAEPAQIKEEYPASGRELAESEPEKEKQETFVEEAADKLADKPVESPEIEIPRKKLPLPADLQEVMDIIRGQGGRITQKDLRSRLKYSEGKVSLMLADLERRELIEKFKRGRGNVVILRDEER